MIHVNADITIKYNPGNRLAGPVKGPLGVAGSVFSVYLSAADRDFYSTGREYPERMSYYSEDDYLAAKYVFYI